jgi:glyoxylase I family protein
VALPARSGDATVPSERSLSCSAPTVPRSLRSTTDRRQRVGVLETSTTWYRRLLGTDPVLDEDVPVLPGHHEGYHHTLFALAGGFVLSLHGHAATDAGQRFDEFRPGLDHVGFGCADRGELERLQGRLEELGIEHGGIAEDAVGYALSFRDPDGVALEFWATRS